MNRHSRPVSFTGIAGLSLPFVLLMTSWYFIEASLGDAAPATSPCGAAATIKSASWQEIRAILLESNCQLGEKTRYSPIVGMPKECEKVYGERPPSPVKQVID